MRLLINTLSIGSMSGNDVVIGNDIGGAVIQGRDVPAMTEAIERLLGDEDLRAEKSSGGRKRAAELFPLEQHTRRCVALYEDAIERHVA